jgi:hypothetical protein
MQRLESGGDNVPEPCCTLEVKHKKTSEQLFVLDYIQCYCVYIWSLYIRHSNERLDRPDSLHGDDPCH